jgi:hypothetical protein
MNSRQLSHYLQMTTAFDVESKQLEFRAMSPAKPGDEVGPIPSALVSV